MKIDKSKVNPAPQNVVCSKQTNSIPLRVRGKTVWCGVNKILVIRLDKIGDLICSVPFLKLLKDNFPKAKLSVMATSYTQDILSSYDFIDEIIIYDFKFSTREKKEFIKNLQMQKFDLAVALSPLALAYWLVYKTKAPRRAGWVYSGRFILNILTSLWLNIKLIAPVDKLLRQNKKIPHEIEQTIKLAEFMGLETKESPQLYLPIKENLLQSDKRFLDITRSSENKFLGLHLSNKWLSDCSGVSDLCEFVNKILNYWKNYKLIITAGPLEKELADIFKSRFLESKDKVFVFDNLELLEWVYLIKNCSLFFTPDTGAVHIASALKIPVVCVFEDKKFSKCSQQWYPWGVKYLALKQSQLKQLTKEDFDKADKLIKVEPRVEVQP